MTGQYLYDKPNTVKYLYITKSHHDTDCLYRKPKKSERDVDELKYHIQRMLASKTSLTAKIQYMAEMYQYIMSEFSCAWNLSVSLIIKLNILKQESTSTGLSPPDRICFLSLTNCQVQCLPME